MSETKTRRRRYGAKTPTGRPIPAPLAGPHRQIKQAEVQEKRRQALELRRLRCTYAEIGKQMSCTAMTAWRYVQDAIAEIPVEVAKDAKRVEIEDCHADLKRINLRLQSGKLTTIEELKALGQKVRLRDQLARYLGHYAPVRTELTGKDGGALAITAVDLESMTDEQLDRIIRGAVGKSPGGGGGSFEAEEAPGAAGQTRRTH